MNDFDRLEIKRLILNEASKDKSKIPFLSYLHLEIIEPELWVDSTLVEEIDAGNPKIPLTDKLFFECIKESIDYLAYEPFRQKIKDWQRIIRGDDPNAANRDRTNAQRNLKEVGKKLAFVGQGRPLKYEQLEYHLRDSYSFLIQELTPFLDETRDMLPYKRAALFKQKFPYWAEYSSIVQEHRAPREIAKEILVKKYGISKRKLLEILIDKKTTILKAPKK